MFRDLLVHVDGSDAGRHRVQLAADLAVRTGARLSGLHVTPPPDVPPRDQPSLVVAEVTAAVASRLASDARAAAALFDEEVTTRGLVDPGGGLAGSSWFEASGDVAHGICDRARYADLVIVGQYERQGSVELHPLPVAHSVMLRCGRPVLVVPASVQPSALDRIALAWDGSRAAVRALHDALPLLRLARSVQVVTMIGTSPAYHPIESKSLCAHLANHQIRMEPRVLQVRSTEEHTMLRKHLEQGQYDLVIMGGYAHPVWLEFIFGGVGQSNPTSSAIPVLVSH